MKNHTYTVFLKCRYYIKNICPIFDKFILWHKQSESSRTVKVFHGLLRLLYINFDIEQIITQLLKKLTLIL